MDKDEFEIILEIKKSGHKVNMKWSEFPREFLMNLKSEEVPNEEIAFLFDVTTKVVFKAIDQIQRYESGLLPKTYRYKLLPTAEEVIIRAVQGYNNILEI